LIGTVLTMALATLAAMGLSALTHLDLRSLTLGMMPGGIAEMSLTAETLQLPVPLVTAMQVMRLLFVLFLAEPLFRRWNRRPICTQPQPNSYPKPLPLRLIQRPHQRKLPINLIHQRPQIPTPWLNRLSLQPLAQLRQPHRPKVPATPFEAVRNPSQRLRIIPGLGQRFDALLGIIEKGIEQLGIFAFHDFLQTRQHLRVQM
jgi:hypothetical protein